jgi:predicted GNAT family N-acyltransferase
MNITYKEVNTINEFIDAIRIRVDVFIREQGFEPGWEPDEEDKVSRHFIALVDNKIVSTARFREINPNEIKIERMVTQKEYRGRKITKNLVSFMIKEIEKLKPKRIWLRSQVKTQPFYEKCGFKTISKPFEMWNVFHIDMEYLK